jgi:segregation and condensation protein A
MSFSNPPELTPADDPYLVGIDRFQGPLDLLLHLIRKQDIDIFDIPIARITAQFLRAIECIERVELERAGEFIEMAATLVRIKAQMLFPRRFEEDDDDPRADLVRRLLEYEHFRDAADLLGRAQTDRARFHGKGYVPPRTTSRSAEVPLETEWSEVWEAILQLTARHNRSEPEPGYRVAPRMVRIEEKMEYVLGRLRGVPRIEFDALVAPWRTRLQAVASLLACLELAKRSSVRLRQEAPFAPLWVLHGHDESDAT